ncbi:MAG: hypothetical protein AAF497_20235 [Planctomycetota bacterium]
MTYLTQPSQITVVTRVAYGLRSLRMTTPLHWLLLSVIALSLVGNAFAKVDWHVGPKFRRQLESPVGITWQSKPLRDGLMNLSEAQRVSIFLDRRVDPGQLVTISVEETSLKEAVRKIARSVGLDIGFCGSVLYVGPPQTCLRLATLAEVRNEQISELPKAAHKRLLTRRSVAWPDLSEPRLLVARMASNVGLTLPNVEAIPHDMWWAQELPPLTFAEQATLVLAGFDMSFRYHQNARQALLSKYPIVVTVERAYPTKDPKKLAEKLEKEYPQAYVESDRKKGRVLVRTMMEDHWEIEASLGRGKRMLNPPKAAASLKRYTLSVENKPVGPLLTLLAKKVEVDLRFDRGVTEEIRSQLVSASVKEATAVQLLSAMAKPAGLKIVTNGSALVVAKE